MVQLNKFLPILSLFLFLGCSDNLNTSSPKNAKLKRISSIHVVLFNEELSCKKYLTDPEAIWYVESDYEYDHLGRLSKVSRPKYEDGKINGVSSYNIYAYNAKNQLEKIEYYVANIYQGIQRSSTYSYSYDKEGNKRKEVISYPIASHLLDSTLYYYENKRLKREEKYSDGYHGTEFWHNKLVTYIEYEYDNQGNLVKETSYYADSAGQEIPVRYNKHSYQDGLNVKTEFFYYNNNQKMREIRRYYDKNNNLIYLESQELLMTSSQSSYVSKYEYY